MRRNFLFWIAVLLAIFMLTGCTSLKNKTPTSSPEQFYKISSLIDYDDKLCGYSNEVYPSNYGTKIVVKDKITGDLIKEYRAEMSTKIAWTGLSSEGYVCEGGTEADNALISVYAQGYAPLVFAYKYPRSQLAIVEVFMVKSCSGGPSFFDNLNISSEVSAELNGNQTAAADYIKEGEDRFYEIIKNQFGFEKTDYTLQCAESDFSRGGYLKVKGTYKDGSPLELYSHWGWCSSGGAGCGWSMCFSSPSEALFASVKNISCNKISSRELRLESCRDAEENAEIFDKEADICSVVNDTTKEAHSRCIGGEFEMINGSKKTVSIVQSSSGSTGFGSDSVEAGDFNCLEAYDN